MKKNYLIISIICLVLGLGAISLIGATGTPSTLVVRTDANNSLVVVGATQTNPITQGVFSSRTLRTDANGNLQVIIGGGPISPTSVSVPASTCAAPALNEQGATTTGIAFTATPSILNCVSGTARTTLTATTLTTTVPIVFSNASFTNAGSIRREGGYLVLNADTTGLAVNSSDNTTSLLLLGSSTANYWNDIILAREAANHSFWRNSTNAQRASWANTYTSSTNYEAFSVDWQTQSNVALVGTRTAATGTGRRLALVAQTSNGSDVYAGILLDRQSAITTITGNPFIALGLFSAAGVPSSASTADNFVALGVGTNTTTAGSFSAVSILPTYNQTSGTAANTDLLINRTQTAVGSGTQRLIDAQVGGVSMFNVDNTGFTQTGSHLFAGGDIRVPSASIFYFANSTIASAPANSLLNIRDNGGTVGIQFNAGTAAPTVGTCGTGTITSGSRNTTGEFTATGATACTVTFGTPAFTNAPFCTVTLRNAPTTTPYISAISTTAFTVSGLTAGDVIAYHCIGRI